MRDEGRPLRSDEGRKKLVFRPNDQREWSSLVPRCFLRDEGSK